MQTPSQFFGQGLYEIQAIQLCLRWFGWLTPRFFVPAESPEHLRISAIPVSKGFRKITAARIAYPRRDALDGQVGHFQEVGRKLETNILHKMHWWLAEHVREVFCKRRPTHVGKRCEAPYRVGGRWLLNHVRDDGSEAAVLKREKKGRVHPDLRQMLAQQQDKALLHERLRQRLRANAWRS